jgi:hypothetical protein
MKLPNATEAEVPEAKIVRTCSIRIIAREKVRLSSLRHGSGVEWPKLAAALRQRF